MYLKLYNYFNPPTPFAKGDSFLLETFQDDKPTIHVLYSFLHFLEEGPKPFDID